MSAELVITEADYGRLAAHLFPGDHDEHAAVVLAGSTERGQRTRLLARELHLVPHDDFTPGEFGYRQTSPRFVAELAMRAAEQELAYVAIHSHPGSRNHTSLSHDDVAGHDRLFPHLLNLTSGRPVAGIALGTASAAGEIWSTDGARQPLGTLRILGDRIVELRPGVQGSMSPSPRFDRQARLFGAAGQEILRRLRVAVIGAGGGGSMLVEQLAHLGVGHLVVIDFDVVKDVNLSRIVGSQPGDIGAKKVSVMKRLVSQIDPDIQIDAIDGDIADLETAQHLIDADFMFLATDTITSRLVFNAIVHRYLVPGVQIGAKVDIDAGGDITQVYMAVRPVLPDRGCLHCNTLIDPMQLQREARTEEERAAQNYLNEPEVIDPSVISLNGFAASSAINVLLFTVTGLSEPSLWDHRLILPRSGDVFPIKDKKLDSCPFCSRSDDSMYARGGDASSLPVRRHGPARVPAADLARYPKRRGLPALARFLRFLGDRTA